MSDISHSNMAGNEEDPLAPLGLPGVARALRAFDLSTIQGLIGDSLRHGRPRIAAMLLKDLACDPSSIDLTIPDAPNSNSRDYSYERMKYDGTMWGKISSALKMGAGDLAKDDWFTLFEVAARALEGKERARGMPTVIYALRRLDARDEAIERFPALFRSARDNKTKMSAFGNMATRSKFGGEAVDSMIKTLEALKKTKLKEQPQDIITAATSANPELRQAFASMFGLPCMVGTQDEKGMTALHHAAMNVGLNQSIEWLIASGADPMARDKTDKTVLQNMAIAQSPPASVAELLRCAEYPASHLKETLETCSWRLTEDVSALLQAQMARLTMAQVASTAKLSAQRNGAAPG